MENTTASTQDPSQGTKSPQASSPPPESSAAADAGGVSAPASAVASTAPASKLDTSAADNVADPVPDPALGNTAAPEAPPAESSGIASAEPSEQEGKGEKKGKDKDKKNKKAKKDKKDKKEEKKEKRRLFGKRKKGTDSSNVADSEPISNIGKPDDQKSEAPQPADTPPAPVQSAQPNTLPPTQPETSAPPSVPTQTETAEPPSEKPKVPSPLDPLPNQGGQPITKKKGPSIVVILIAVIILLLSSAATAAALVVYEVVPFPQEGLKNKITDVFMMIPFVPRTKSYVLRSMVESHKNVRSAKVDLSIATSAAGVQDILGLEEFDFAIRGFYDISNLDSPLASYNITIPNQLDTDVLVVDNGLFFNVKAIPTFIKSKLGVMSDTSLDSIMNVWVHKDITPFESNARTALEQFEEDNSADEPIEKKVFRDFFKEDVMPKVEMVEESMDDHKTYKMSVSFDTDQIMELGRALREDLQKAYEDAPADAARSGMYDRLAGVAEDDTSGDEGKVVQNMLVNVWIDAEDYYLRKAIMTLRLEANVLDYAQPSLGNAFVLGDSATLEPIDLTIALKMDEFGGSFSFTAPEVFMEVEDFVREVLRSFSLGMLGNPYLSAFHAQFITDHALVKEAVQSAWTDSDILPASYDDLAAYLTVIPEGIFISRALTEDVVLVYGYDPLPDAPGKNYLITSLEDVADETEAYYSFDEATELFDYLGVADTLPEPYMGSSTEPLNDESGITTPVPLVPESPGSGTPFGQYLN